MNIKSAWKKWILNRLLGLSDDPKDRQIGRIMIATWGSGWVIVGIIVFIIRSIPR